MSPSSPALIVLSGHIINPAHVAFAERRTDGTLVIHMATVTSSGDSRFGVFTNNDVIGLSGEDARTALAAFQKLGADRTAA